LILSACDDGESEGLPDLGQIAKVAPDDGRSEGADLIELGRHLFYDSRLSVNGSRSCGTCHEQAKAFTDGFPRAVGATREVHFHNSPSLTNVVHRALLNWANPAPQSLEQQMLTPLFGAHPIEMGLEGTGDATLQKLVATPVYQRLFAAAFPDAGAMYSPRHLQRALAAFERVLQSDDSPFDRYRRGQSGALSQTAIAGMKVFFDEQTGGCLLCHHGADLDRTIQSPTGHQGFFNVGLYNLDGKGAYPAGAPGLYSFTGQVRDMGRFRTPTLRNVAITGPYFHDGSVSTLFEAIAVHINGGRLVSEGPRQGDGRTSPLRDPLLAPRSLTGEQVWQLEVFLRSLTDDAFLSNPRFANPW